jgi:hypothetical protein
VCLGERLVQTQGLFSSRPCERIRFSRRENLVGTELRIAIGQSGIGEGVPGVLFDGLLKVLDGFLESLPGPPVEEVATFYIELVRLAAHGACREALLFLLTYVRPHLTRHIVRHVGGKRRQLRQPSGIGLSPQP